FFFFQAEDGIRDFHVTGVQTCALPICYREVSSGLTPIMQMLARRKPGANLPVAGSPKAALAETAVCRSCKSSAACPRGRFSSGRSEERRVGKECVRRWLQCS